jgi:hypothetical protein
MTTHSRSSLAASYILVLASCQTEHVVTLQLGGDVRSISQGFLCRTEVAIAGLQAEDFLLERGHDLATGAVTFSLVVDAVSLGDVLPGCLPEEILGVCSDTSACPISERFCAEVSADGPKGKRLSEMSRPERDQFVRNLAERLQALPPVFRDAPDGPLVVRAVASSERCDNLTETFKVEKLMACAYSCPVILDDLDGALRLGFATSDDYCAPQVKGCAAYPASF